jgi:hypothetical protein
MGGECGGNKRGKWHTVCWVRDMLNGKFVTVGVDENVWRDAGFGEESIRIALGTVMVRLGVGVGGGGVKTKEKLGEDSNDKRE